LNLILLYKGAMESKWHSLSKLEFEGFLASLGIPHDEIGFIFLSIIQEGHEIAIIFILSVGSRLK
jgi:hypothetical protein